MSTSGSKERRAWRAMRARCLNPKAVNYKWYGGRGIKICDEWVNSFDSFLEHVGRAPGPEYSLDRIDNELGYQPGNVRWATMDQQAMTRRVGRKWWDKTISYNTDAEELWNFYHDP